MTRLRTFLALAALTSIAVALAAHPASRTTFSSPSRSAGSVAPSAPMLEPRSGHSATLLNDGRVLIAGGMRRNQDFYRSAELYDPRAGKFERAGDMTVQRVGHIGVLLPSGKVLIAGGWIGQGVTDSVELFDPAARTFTRIAPMTTPRAHPTATALPNGDVLIAGGTAGGGPSDALASAEIFHPSTLTFTAVAPMHYAREAHTATLLRNGRVLIAGGRSDKVVAPAEVFDPKTSRFTVTGALKTARYKHTAGQLPDGRVLIAGGSDERDWHGTFNTAEIYDPRTGQFTAAPALNDSRFKLPQQAVQLASGAILIAGGSREVEVYDPAAARFMVASGQISDRWHFMSETRLKDGSVLLAGGYPDNDRATSSTWIYRP